MTKKYEHADNKFSLMKNYVVLLEESGRDREALVMRQRLDRKLVALDREIPH